MTIAEFIEELKTLPQDAIVQYWNDGLPRGAYPGELEVRGGVLEL